MTGSESQVVQHPFTILFSLFLSLLSFFPFFFYGEPIASSYPRTAYQENRENHSISEKYPGGSAWDRVLAEINEREQFTHIASEKYLRAETNINYSRLDCRG